MNRAASTAPVLEAAGVSKNFGAVTALQDVDLTIGPGDVVGLVGDNGAGKSTLVKILSGVIQPSSGQVRYEGEAVELHGPADARARGVETVYQHLALVEEFSVAANMFLGRERFRRGRMSKLLRILDHAGMGQSAAEAIEGMHVKIPALASMPIHKMSGGQRQAVAIARSVLWGGTALILDEPTAALGVQESEQVMKLIEDLHAKGMPMLVVSHSLPMVFRVCNRIVALRVGQKVADVRTEDTNPEQVVQFITGANLVEQPRPNGAG